ncbi:hypothetical protein BCT27_17635 [Enterovibrio norvegicus]|nr:hypothetical protein BCT27_17635 [Enterovibrio norvegicus]
MRGFFIQIEEGKCEISGCKQRRIFEFIEMYSDKRYHKKISIVSLVNNIYVPIMLKTGASANAPVFLCLLDGEYSSYLPIAKIHEHCPKGHRL